MPWRVNVVSAAVLTGLISLTAAAQLPGAAMDVLEYRFHLELDDASDEIVGRALIRFRLLTDASEVTFDLDDSLSPAAPAEAENPGESADAVRGMTVLSITRADSGEAVSFRHAADRLQIRLGTASRGGDEHELEIRYRGVPFDGLVIGRNRHGERTFFADNWPDRAHHWLPVVDHPSDKAKVAFAVTAPAHYQVVATGAFVQAADQRDGRRRTVWRSRAPVATKVMAVGVARFFRRRVGEVDGVPVETWVYPQDREAGLRAFAPGPRVLGAFERRLGDYPFAKLANVQTTTRWGGLENAGNVFYAEDAVDREGGIETLIAHEVAHQWFGDSVTESDWPHVWLSEGFATYLAACYLEWTYGDERFREQMASARDRVLRHLERDPDGVIVPGAVADPRRLLSPNVYQKAAWVLHMLRGELGEGVFWRGMRTYYERFRDGNAATRDFVAVMEELSGRDLDWFFDQWLRQPGVPNLELVWRFDDGSALVELEVSQVASGTWRLPLDIEAILPGGDVIRSRIEVTGERTEASFRAPSRPANLRIDPRSRLLLR